MATNVSMNRARPLLLGLSMLYVAALCASCDGGSDADGGGMGGGGASGGGTAGGNVGGGARDARGDTPDATDGGTVGPLVCHGCSAGETLCQDVCYRNDDPQRGCGTCAPCAARPHTVTGCTATGCGTKACAPNWDDCNLDAMDGCETSLTTLTNCGACGATCQAGEKCSPSGCVAACQPPLTPCGDACVNIATSPSHCGQCGQACPVPLDGTPTCSGGTCGIQCPPGKSPCGGACVDLQNDPLNCGACSTVCPRAGTGPAACSGGVCRCSPGFSYCTKNFAACALTQQDPSHCGAGCDYCTDSCFGGQCGNLADKSFLTGVSPSSAATDANFLYWPDSTAGTIHRVALTGGMPETLARDQAKPDKIAVDDTHVYWINVLGAAVMKLAKSGGMPELLAPANQPFALAIDSTYAYFANTGDKTVARVPKAGGMANTVVTADLTLVAMVIAGDNVIFQQCGDCARDDLACIQKNSTFKIGKSGGTPALLDPPVATATFGCTFAPLVGNGSMFATALNRNGVWGGVYDENGRQMFELTYYPDFMSRDFLYVRNTQTELMKFALCAPPNYTQMFRQLGGTVYTSFYPLATEGGFLYGRFNRTGVGVSGIWRIPQ